MLPTSGPSGEIRRRRVTGESRRPGRFRAVYEGFQVPRPAWSSVFLCKFWRSYYFHLSCSAGTIQSC
eukprot:2867380-Pyramimonas_sp.AAC.1